MPAYRSGALHVLRPLPEPQEALKHHLCGDAVAVPGHRSRALVSGCGLIHIHAQLPFPPLQLLRLICSLHASEIKGFSAL